MAVCNIGDHVWIASKGRLLEMVVKQIFDEVNASDPLYELAAVGGTPFEYKFRYKRDFFVIKEAAIAMAEKQADDIINKANQTIAMAKCEIRYAKRCKKQLEKAAKESK